MKDTTGTWTQFWDMHSGGGAKEKHEMIYIQAPEKEARVVFYNRFGHNPDRVSCTCCGADYSVSESDNLDDMRAYEREKSVLLIFSDEITPKERIGDVPMEGYVWH